MSSLNSRHIDVDAEALILAAERELSMHLQDGHHLSNKELKSFHLSTRKLHRRLLSALDEATSICVHYCFPQPPFNTLLLGDDETLGGFTEDALAPDDSGDSSDGSSEEIINELYLNGYDIELDNGDGDDDLEKLESVLMTTSRFIMRGGKRPQRQVCGLSDVEDGRSVDDSDTTLIVDVGLS